MGRSGGGKQRIIQGKPRCKRMDFIYAPRCPVHFYFPLNSYMHIERQVHSLKGREVRDQTNNPQFEKQEVYPIKTCLCKVYHLEPHFYILGFAGVYLLFLFLLQNIDCGYSLEPPREWQFYQCFELK